MSPILLEMPQGQMEFHRLVLDYTGTLSMDGALLPGVGERLQRLSAGITITVLTADTFGTARGELEDLPIEVRVIQDGEEKAGVVATMDPQGVIAIGNGRNDIPMMELAGLSIAVMGPEGAASGLLESVDVVTRDIIDALDLILHPLRLKATLRD